MPHRILPRHTALQHTELPLMVPLRRGADCVHVPRLWPEAPVGHENRRLVVGDGELDARGAGVEYSAVAAPGACLIQLPPAAVDEEGSHLGHDLLWALSGLADDDQPATAYLRATAKIVGVSQVQILGQREDELWCGVE